MDPFQTLLQDSLKAAPILCVTLLSLVVLLIHAFRKNSEELQFGVSLAGIAACIAVAAATLAHPAAVYGGSLLTGGYAGVFTIIFLLAAGLTLLISRDYLRKVGMHFGEYYALILFTVVGMIALASGLDLIVTFLGLELMSISLYVLAGFTRRVPRANEAALKYFLLGAFATGFLLYGIALIYGATGATKIARIASIAAAGEPGLLFFAGVGMLAIGLGFKVAAVPFHMWVPDVYEGAPTSVSAFMSTGAKSAAFGAFLLIFTATFGFAGTKVNLVLALLSAASMILGNFVAIAQSNIKRMLAYSSIAHAGYILIGLAAGSAASVPAVIFYLISYTLTNLGAFGIVALLESEAQGNLDIDDYAGLGSRKPLLAALMSMFMFSLAGIPPFAGFFGKYYVFYAAVRQGYTWLVVLGVLTSVVSVYFYLRIVVVMYFRDAARAEPVAVPVPSMTSYLISAAGILLIGILPSIVLDFLTALF